MSNHDYSPGDLVWAKVDGHPYWPSLVCNSPQDHTHSKITKKGIQIHVQFFSSPWTRAWVKVKSVRPFAGRKIDDCKPGGIFYSNKKALWLAVEEAEKAEFMTLKERLQLMIASPCKDDDEADDEEDDDDDDDDYDDDDDILKDNKKHKSITKQSTKQPQAKKRKAVKEPIKPNKIRKTSTSPQKMKKTSSNPPVSQSFKIGKSKIPKHWKTAYVLMNTNDVPEDLTPDDFITVKALPIKKEHIELELPEESDEYNDLDSEDEILDSDEDPGWSPEVEKSDDDILEDEPDLADSDDESVEDSDEDPGWSPSKNKKQTEKRPKQFGLIGKQKTGQKTSPQSKQKSAPKTSLKSTRTVPQKKTSSEVKKTAASTVSDKPAATSGSAVPANKQNRNVVITDNSPTGFVPEIGDFVLEKEECQDGNIPYLWRYKRGGLIQKYERMEEDGKVFYQNVLSFSDWWACFAHRYQKVETQTLYRYKNLEKVEITKQPVIEPVPEIASSPAAPKGNSTQSTDNNNKETTNNKNKTTERMQEQEISSTTQDTGTDIPDRAFQIGQFVLDMKDKRNVDNFPIWKIESQILLKKYEPVFKNGRMRHRPVKTYRGYKDISKHYLSITVNRCMNEPGEEHVEVTEDTKPKITLTSTMEEEYEKNPLLRHFYVYMQVFLSQALEPGFLDEVRKTNDPTYIFPLGEIDKIVDQKTVNIERKVKWTNRVKDALKKCPYLREVNKPDDKRKCEALAHSDELVEESVFLFGSDYDKDTLKHSGNSHPCQEFKIGKTAVKHMSTYHQLCHFKYNLYDKCLAKIKLIRDSKEGGVEVEKIMDECLGNKAWVIQNFEDFMTLVEMT